MSQEQTVWRASTEEEQHGQGPMTLAELDGSMSDEEEHGDGGPMTIAELDAPADPRSRSPSFEEDEIQLDGEYYWYNSICYHGAFPVEWAKNHYPDTGPLECWNCEDYGCVNGIFVGYCANCAQYVYEGERGRGFFDHGVELDDPSYPSAFETYLKDEVLETHVPTLGEDMDIDMIDPPEDAKYGHYNPCFSHYEGGYNDF